MQPGRWRTPVVSLSASTVWPWRCSACTVSSRRAGRRPCVRPSRSSTAQRSGRASLPTVPLDPHAKRFLERLAAVNPPSALSLSVAERREALRTLLGFAAPPPALGHIEDRSCEGPGGPLPLRIYTPADADPGLLPGFVYFHGGGMVAGSVDTHDAIARSLCAASGCRLVAVDYRLAPEARFPAAVEDVL